MPKLAATFYTRLTFNCWSKESKKGLRYRLRLVLRPVPSILQWS